MKGGEPQDSHPSEFTSAGVGHLRKTCVARMVDPTCGSAYENWESQPLPLRSHTNKENELINKLVLVVALVSPAMTVVAQPAASPTSLNTAGALFAMRETCSSRHAEMLPCRLCDAGNGRTQRAYVATWRWRPASCTGRVQSGRLGRANSRSNDEGLPSLGRGRDCRRAGSFLSLITVVPARNVKCRPRAPGRRRLRHFDGPFSRAARREWRV